MGEAGNSAAVTGAPAPIRGAALPSNEKGGYRRPLSAPALSPAVYWLWVPLIVSPTRLVKGTNGTMRPL